MRLTDNEKYWLSKLGVIIDTVPSDQNNKSHCLYPQGRALKNYSDEYWNTIAPKCINCILITKQKPEATLKDLVNILLSNGKVCTPVIAPDGSIKIGESALCPKIASIYDSVPEIMEKIRNARCRACKIPWEKLKEKIDIFGDARDDVIELICAELFAVSSISNFPSFVSGSLNAYMRYSSNDKKENKEIYDLYVQKYLEDIRSFGEATAIYQRRNDKKIEKRKPRRPILLVPACTTRAVDYYVFGQGFYLSAGLKTVFCNSVGTGGRGGSCFIGPDSWDDYKINKNEFLMQNTIYHGLKPGIYMQTEPDKCRGALGSEEQALLICDVQPHLDKGNPNAESMMSAFSLVAHIPVFEEKRYVGQSDGKDGKSTIKCYGKCEKQRYCHDMVEENLKQYLGDIENYCKKYEAEQGYRLSAQDENAKKDKIIEKMKALGEYYKSDWFIKRAEYYAKYRWTYPQAWPPPTLTDWLFIETDYDKFRKKEIDADLGECRIQIPEYED